MAVERDLIAHLAHLAVLGIAVSGINPRIRHMRRDLAGKVGLYGFFQRDVLGIAQVAIRLGVSVAVAADFGSFVPLANACNDGFEDGGLELQPSFL